MTISANHTAPDQTSKAPAGDALTEAVKKFGITAEDYMLPARHQIEMVDPDGRLKPVGEQGTEPGHEYPLPGDEELLAAYEQLVVGRRVMTSIRHWSGRAAWPYTDCENATSEVLNLTASYIRPMSSSSRGQSRHPNQEYTSAAGGPAR